MFVLLLAGFCGAELYQECIDNPSLYGIDCSLGNWMCRVLCPRTAFNIPGFLHSSDQTRYLSTKISRDIDSFVSVLPELYLFYLQRDQLTVLKSVISETISPLKDDSGIYCAPINHQNIQYLRLEDFFKIARCVDLIDLLMVCIDKNYDVFDVLLDHIQSYVDDANRFGRDPGIADELRVLRSLRNPGNIGPLEDFVRNASPSRNKGKADKFLARIHHNRPDDDLHEPPSLEVPSAISTKTRVSSVEQDCSEPVASGTIIFSCVLLGLLLAVN